MGLFFFRVRPNPGISPGKAQGGALTQAEEVAPPPLTLSFSHPPVCGDEDMGSHTHTHAHTHTHHHTHTPSRKHTHTHTHTHTCLCSCSAQSPVKGMTHTHTHTHIQAVGL